MATTDIIGRGWTFPPRIGVQGGVILTNDRNEIEESIRIIVSTSPGQRVMRPKFGCRIHELIFAPNDSDTSGKARRYVEEALRMWEPRIKIMEVNAYPDPDRNNALVIEIKYQVKATNDLRSLVYPFYLIPEE